MCSIYVGILLIKIPFGKFIICKIEPTPLFFKPLRSLERGNDINKYFKREFPIIFCSFFTQSIQTRSQLVTTTSMMSLYHS